MAIASLQSEVWVPPELTAKKINNKADEPSIKSTSFEKKTTVSRNFTKDGSS